MRYLLMIPLLLCASPAPGAEFTVLRPQQSNVSFVSKQMGVPVEGNFKKFAARIAVDPARPEAGLARIDIELAVAVIHQPGAIRQIERDILVVGRPELN